MLIFVHALRNLLLLLVFCHSAPPVLAQSLIDEGFVAAQEGMLSAAGSALRQIGLRTAADTGPLADLVRERQALEERLRETSAAMAKAGADRIGLAGLIDGLNAELAAVDRRLVAEFPKYIELTRPKSLSIAEVQALLQPDEALIFTFVGHTYSFVWSISSTRSGWHRVNAARDHLSEAVKQLRDDLDPTLPSRGAQALEGEDRPIPRGRSFDRRLAKVIYDVFLEPLEPVFEEADHIYIVGDGPLTSLPFGLLVSDSFDGADDDPAALRTTPWMIRRFALTTLPSVESLSVVKSLPAPAEGRPLLAAYGDPAFSGGASLAGMTRGAALVSGGLADVDRLRSLPPLPETRTELLSIAETLGASSETLHLGEAATEAAVKQGIGPASVVAFATHGLLSGELEGLAEPALVLTPPKQASKLDDGLLTASEIIDLKLDADWVLLSACNTAGGDEPGAEGLSGLARAFLFAGARSIVVSHWPVRDDAAARLTTHALKVYGGGKVRRAEALRQSMLAVMDDTRDPSLAHPSAWAPFVIVGQGG